MPPSSVSGNEPKVDSRCHRQSHVLSFRLSINFPSKTVELYCKRARPMAAPYWRQPALYRQQRVAARLGIEAPRPLLLSRRATPDGSARCLLLLYCAAPLFVLHMAPVWIDGCIIRISTDIKYLAPGILLNNREVNEAGWPHTCSRPCAFEEKKRSKNTKSRRTQNTP